MEWINMCIKSIYDEYRHNISLYLRSPKWLLRIPKYYVHRGDYVYRGDRYGHRPKREQRESAYVSRKRVWRTLLEPSSHPPVLHRNRSRSFRNQCWTCWYIKETPCNPPSVLWAVFDLSLSCDRLPVTSSLSFHPPFKNR